MTATIQAAYLPESNRLLFRVPFALNGLIREMPSRRFDPKTKLWAAPLLSANLRYIRQMQANGVLIQFSPNATEAIDRLEQTLSAPRTERFPTKYEFRAPFPMKHQMEALNRAWPRPGFGLFMDMGTGKSRVVVDLACARYNAEQIEQVLIMCPLSVRRNWIGQWDTWATVPIDWHLLNSANPKGFEKFLGFDRDAMPVLIAGIEGLGQSERQFDMLTQYVRRAPTLVVFDESSKIKNPTKNRTKRGILLAHAAGGAIVMNGTPIANGIQDLYSQIEAVNPNIIGVGDHYAFRNRYCIMGGYEDKQIVGYRNVEELMELLAPWVYQVRKADVLTELPPKVYEQRTVDPTGAQKDILDQIRRQPLKQDPGTGEIPTKNILERMLRLQQAIGGYQAIINADGTLTTTPIEGVNPKMDELMDILEESVPQKVIVWARFVPEIEAIIERIAATYGPESVVKYYGSVPEDERAANVQRFQTDPTCRFFVGNQAAGGLGIELFAATVEVYFSNSFAYIDRQQSEDRAHRKGQLNSVTIIDLIMRHTLDDAITQALVHKQNVDEFVRSALAAEKNQAGWITRMLKDPAVSAH